MTLQATDRSCVFSLACLITLLCNGDHSVIFFFQSSWCVERVVISICSFLLHTNRPSSSRNETLDNEKNTSPLLFLCITFVIVTSLIWWSMTHTRVTRSAQRCLYHLFTSHWQRDVCVTCFLHSVCFAIHRTGNELNSSSSIVDNLREHCDTFHQQ